MSWKQTLLAALTALVLLVAAGGCSPDSAEQATESTPEVGGETSEPAGEWAKTLPTVPGTSWDMARYTAGGEVPVQLSVEGPWTLPGGGDGWETVTLEIVDPADVPGIESFSEYDYVLKSVEEYGTFYYPRQITAEWSLQFGKITESGTDLIVEPYTEPIKMWPVDLEVGDTFVVTEGESFNTNATVLAKNSVTVPGGTFDEAYLVRFDYEAMAEGAPSGSQYYILSPDVGQVAVFMVSAGDETTGFTGLSMAGVLTRLPEKQ